jgi:Protein of unknown function (DUF3995)
VRLIAIALTAVLLTLAAIHIYWALRGVGTTASIPTRSDGTPVLRPGRVATFAVAIALSVAALLIATRAGLMHAKLPEQLIDLGTWAVAAAFALRAVGDFHYVGLFKRVRDTPFARWDTRLFTPLCALIATGTAVVAMS